jgi:ADP-heptose:LPS heptosyltransferase
MFNTPILFIIFNRPDVTEEVFNEIRKAKPTQLYIAADGPREHNAYDEELCKKTREIVHNIDWPCEVKTLFREKNLGCGKAVSSAITWFFSEVEQGIILEDDCLPHPSFFNYCQTLLDYYKTDERVMHIGGVNFQDQSRGTGSYYFSAVTHVWGWATWRRAWKNYDFHVHDYYTFVREGTIYSYFKNELIAEHWLNTFKLMFHHQVDTWDHQWSYTIFNNGGLSIIPNVNLISNIGFRHDATHTFADNSIYANAKTTEIPFPLKHPNTVEIERQADYYFFKDVEKLPTKEVGVFSKIYQSLNAFAIRVFEYIFRHYMFVKKIKTPEKHILIQKIDAVGDYIIARNFFEYIIRHESFKGYRFYLLANVRLRSFIEETDRSLYEEVIYADLNKLDTLKDKFRFYKRLRNLKLDTIIHSTYSRSFVTDEIIFRSGAHKAIGFLGDTTNISVDHKRITDAYYSSLVDVDKELEPLSHEFEKQKTFFETILKEKVLIPKPVIGSGEVKAEQEPCLVICPGAQHARRAWKAGHFSKLINLMVKDFKTLHIIIVCGPNEEPIGNSIIGNCADPSQVKLVNTTSIYSLYRQIEKASLVVANDSAPIHIAVALNKKSVCISNGNHYKRFVSYPKQVYSDLKVVFPPFFNKNLNDEFAATYYKETSKLNINEILPESVYEACKPFLASNKK